MNVVVRALGVTLSLALAAAVATVSVEGPASAYNSANCKKPSTLNFYKIGPAAYPTATKNALDAWEAAPVPLAFSATSTNADIRFGLGGYGSSGYDGITWTWCGTGTQTAASDTYYNDYYAANYSSVMRKQVMVHELGHIMGIDHAGGSACAGQPIMYESSSRYTVCGHQNPQPDDINGINAIY